jgi:hypothetical protein
MLSNLVSTRGFNFDNIQFIFLKRINELIMKLTYPIVGTTYIMQIRNFVIAVKSIFVFPLTIYEIMIFMLLQFK